MQSGWHVIYVASRQEQKVGRILQQLGIECYVPMTRELRQWSDRKKWVDLPMFRGYVFVLSGGRGEEVVRVNGVVNYLRFQGALALVKDKELEIIRKIEQSGYYAEQHLKTDDFEEGEEVEISSGPLMGHKGSIFRKDNEQFFTLYFESIGQALKIRVPFELISKT